VQRWTSSADARWLYCTRPPIAALKHVRAEALHVGFEAENEASKKDKTKEYKNLGHINNIFKSQVN